MDEEIISITVCSVDESNNAAVTVNTAASVVVAGGYYPRHSGLYL